MAQNLARLEEAAWPVFRSGHVPMIGEWVALPVLRSAGAGGVLDPLAEQVMYPTAAPLQHCDAVLRLPGESTGPIRTSRSPASAACPSTTGSRTSLGTREMSSATERSAWLSGKMTP